MLIHKQTMGVLDLYWTGRYRTGPDGVEEPVMGEYTMEGFDQADWWEVPRGSALGKKLRRMYPYCTAVVGADGSLIDVTPVCDAPKKAPARPPERKNRQKQRRRRSGVLEHIFDEEW